MATRRATNGAAVRAIREALGKTQDEVAAETGIAATHVSNIEAGRRQPSPGLAVRLAAVLGVPLAAITYPVSGAWPDLTEDDLEDQAAAVSSASTAAA